MKQTIVNKDWPMLLVWCHTDIPTTLYWLLTQSRQWTAGVDHTAPLVCDMPTQSSAVQLAKACRHVHRLILNM